MSKRNIILFIILIISIILSIVSMVLVIQKAPEYWTLALLIILYAISFPATICFSYDKVKRIILRGGFRESFILGYYWDDLFFLMVLISPIAAIFYIRSCYYQYVDKKREEELNNLCQ